MSVDAAGLDTENIAAVEIVVDGVGALLIDDLRFELGTAGGHSSSRGRIESARKSRGFTIGMSR
jgi:hypothetical protein